MKLIHHHWQKVEDKKLKHKVCTECKCEKFYDEGFGQLIFIDRFGKMFYRTPSCVLPYTLL
jgi:hypothetical protein